MIRTIKEFEILEDIANAKIIAAKYTYFFCKAKKPNKIKKMLYT